MNAPMMLPWLARKWGVSDERALVLWQQACTDAQQATGECNTSKYWGFAKSRLFDLLDTEILSTVPGSAMPWKMMELNVKRAMAYTRMWLASLKQGAYS